MKKQLLSRMLPVAIGMALGTCALAQPGTLDESFNGKGIKEIAFRQNISSDSVVATVLQPDGKLLVALVDNAGILPTENAVVIRLNSNGERDNSFGVGGKVNVSNSVITNFHHNAIALQSDGRIVLAGHTYISGNTTFLCLVRLNADGSKDDTFGEAIGQKKKGYRNITSNTGYTFRTVQVLNNTGTILAAGSRENGASGSLIYTATDQYGTVVTNYGSVTTGIVTLDFGVSPSAGFYNLVRASVLDQNSEVWYVAVTTGQGTNFRFGVAAIDASSGARKLTYQAQGKYVLPVLTGTNGNDCQAIAFTPDNKSLLLAGSQDFSLSKMMVYKLDKKLKPDSSFSADAISTYSIPNASDCKALSIAAETGDKVLLSGYALVPNTGGVAAFIKINSKTAAVESDFGSNGTKIFTDKSTNGISRLVYLTGLRKYIGAGDYSINAAYDVFVKRIELDGNPDNSYGKSSEVLCHAEDATASIEDIHERGDGKIWVCGNTASNGYATIALLNKDGSFDPSFKNNFGDTEPGAQYISSFLPMPPAGSNPLPNAKAYAIAETSDGKLLVAGTYQINGNSAITPFVLKLKKSNGIWIRDTDFGVSTQGYIIMPLGAGDDYVQDMIIQPDGKILLYGYVFNGGANNAAVTRLTSSGAIDATTFATTSSYAAGTYVQPLTSAELNSPARLSFALQPDKKIVCTGPGRNAQGLPVFLAFRLGENGQADAVFNANAKAALNFDRATSIALLLKKDGRIVLGGQKDTSNGKWYAMAQLKADGKIDPTFDNDGKLFINKGLGVQAIVELTESTSGALVATAVGAISDGGYFLVMGIRVSAAGEVDRTFYGNGLLPVAKGFPQSTLSSDGSLFIFGQRNAAEQTAVAFMLKMKLGTGQVVKTTNLVLANLTVQYGDAPFKLQPITNSPAKVYYTTTRSSCAEVDPATGEVTITCATIDSGVDVEIRALQLPVNGYTGDTTYASIKVLKGVPRILFTNQGGVIDDTLTVLALSNSGATPTFTQLDGADKVQFITTKKAKIIGVGSSTVSAVFPATSNYEAATAVALITGYTEINAPDANKDDAEFVFDSQDNISIDLLSNDEAYTGVIVPYSVDLDPSTPARDSFYVSPALGLFEVDSTGVVTYTPFSGFLGSGDITYTIRDSKGLKSAPGIIHVAVIPKENVPSLKATELITPNNDGLNEAFVIGFVNLEKENELKIFDRNGLELFTQNNYQNDWTGILPNGKTVENGIYYYVFVEGNNDGQRELKGAFEIRR
jgi:uncharacterized delta-60 repeat protein/gliding motility-associated-like protein